MRLRPSKEILKSRTKKLRQISKKDRPIVRVRKWKPNYSKINKLLKKELERCKKFNKS
jgi:hypothetical protein